ncbi:MAG: hypothetical protein KGR26_07700, partial [Cyanobacteria bacterium REEB65]|nr:hypothetical protein [Cyanobacteria bacterium REEB65]
MREVSRLWHTLETAPVLAGVELAWAERLADDLEVARPFLLPESKLSETYPCPYGGGEHCPRRVVRHGGDDIVAVCDNDEPPDCDALYLKREDVVVQRFDTCAFARAVASLLALENASGKAIDGHRGILDLGTLAV